MRCWWCGVEPVGVYDVHNLESAEPVQVAVWQGGGDHPHRVQPPTPDELIENAYELLQQRLG
jgi:hypothetical protein